jgi:hypothetical protein
MTARRFAEDTKVPIDRTISEIKTALKKAGADQIAVFESNHQTAVAFTLGTGMYRITVPLRVIGRPTQAQIAQNERRSWRLLNLLIKAKLQGVAEGVTTIEREFLADRILYDGQTLSEHILPELKLAHEEGRMPTQLLLGGPK